MLAYSFTYYDEVEQHRKLYKQKFRWIFRLTLEFIDKTLRELICFQPKKNSFFNNQKGLDTLGHMLFQIIKSQLF